MLCRFTAKYAPKHFNPAITCRLHPKMLLTVLCFIMGCGTIMAKLDIILAPLSIIVISLSIGAGWWCIVTCWCCTVMGHLHKVVGWSWIDVFTVGSHHHSSWQCRGTIFTLSLLRWQYHDTVITPSLMRWKRHDTVIMPLQWGIFFTLMWFNPA